MTLSVAQLVYASSTETDDSDPMGFIILAVAIALASVIMGAVLRRRARKTIASATEGVENAFAFVIAPAHPLTESVERLRALIGDDSTVAISRYSRLTVVAEASGLSITDKKAGRVLTIPSADIVSIEARKASIKPHGLPYSRTFPAVWVGVQRGATVLEVALAPLSGGYDPITMGETQALVTGLVARLDLRGSTSSTTM